MGVIKLGIVGHGIKKRIDKEKNVYYYPKTSNFEVLKGCSCCIFLASSETCLDMIEKWSKYIHDIGGIFIVFSNCEKCVNSGFSDLSIYARSVSSWQKALDSIISFITLPNNPKAFLNTTSSEIMKYLKENSRIQIYQTEIKKSEKKFKWNRDVFPLTRGRMKQDSKKFFLMYMDSNIGICNIMHYAKDWLSDERDCFNIYKQDNQTYMHMDIFYFDK